MFRQINTSSLSLDRENDKSVKDFIPNNISNNSRLGKKEERFERREKKGNLFFFPRLRIFKKNLFSMNIVKFPFHSSVLLHSFHFIHSFHSCFSLLIIDKWIR